MAPYQSAIVDPELEAWVTGMVSERADWFVGLCQDLVRIPSPNPPGDTTRIASHVKGLLVERGIPFHEYSPREGNPNLVAKLGTGNSPTLSLNAHLDTFPVVDPADWTFDPYSGQVHQGKLYGRGSADMKAGLAAALGTVLMMAEEGVTLSGTVSLSMVSDEETGSKWGTWWLAENVPGVLGDACLIGEPTGPLTPVIGEKAPLWVRVTTYSRPMHGALSNGYDAVWQMARAIVAIQTLSGLVYTPPKEIAALVAEFKRKEREAGSGNDWWLDQPSINFGRISGGVKVNVVPSSCELELDIRVPFGAASAELLDELHRRLAEANVQAKVEVVMGTSDNPNFTSIEAPFLHLVRETIRGVTGNEPQFVLAPYFTDGRVFRVHGVPTVACGPRDHGMAGPDEHIVVDEYIEIVRIFALTAAAYCGVRIPEERAKPE